MRGTDCPRRVRADPGAGRLGGVCPMAALILRMFLLQSDPESQASKLHILDITYIVYKYPYVRCGRKVGDSSCA